LSFELFSPPKINHEIRDVVERATSLSIKGYRFPVNLGRFSKPDQMAVTVSALHLEQTPVVIAVSYPKIVATHLCGSENASRSANRIVSYY
jgi:hypothetical protein